MQDLLSSDVTDEGLRAVSASNSNAIKLLITPLDKQRQVIAEAVKQSDTFFDKVRPTAGKREFIKAIK